MDIRKKLDIEIKKNQIKSDIFQAVSHTLNNLISVENNIIKKLSTTKDLQKSIKKLELFQLIISSILNSIQIVFSNNEELHNIKIFKNDSPTRIKVSSVILFALSLNINHLLKGVGRWEGIYDLFFDISDENEDEIDEIIENIFLNSKFNISDLTDTQIEDFYNYLFSKDMNILNRYFFIDLKLLDNFFVEKEDYSFALFFIVFQELIKNMFKYGTIRDKKKQIFRIYTEWKENQYLLIIENAFNKDSHSIMKNTLQGLKMVKMFSEILGGFKKIEQDEVFRVEIILNKNIFY